MLKNVTHAGGVENVDEILFSTPFGYMFHDLARRPECLLPESERTEDALLMLGDAMGEPAGGGSGDSCIPAIFTYLGQFIDHDITARTDRETELSRIAQPDGRPLPITPLDPNVVVGGLANGRRPQLDLDSVYGDGPSLLESPLIDAQTEADALEGGARVGLYDTEKRLLMQTDGGAFDLPRDGRAARIADGRNDENLNVSQLHAAFLAFHNRLMDTFLVTHQPVPAYIKARQLVRWTYQYVVVNDYLMNVCDRNVVRDVIRNGPRFFGPGMGGEEIFMPLEFSVAGFRFGHSMVRGTYRVQGTVELSIAEILGVSREHPVSADDLLEAVGDAFRLRTDRIVDWSNFAQFHGEPAPQMARPIDPLLAEGLFEMPFVETPAGTMLRHLAKRNLLRGYLLSIPTGQAVAAAMGIVPLSETQLLDGVPASVAAALAHGRFQNRTPLWYYVLREAQVQKGGNTLGAVGSRLVAETLVGLINHSPNSYVHQRHPWRVRQNGIKLPGRPDPVSSIAELLDYAGARH